jgi:hypothetical protein
VLRINRWSCYAVVLIVCFSASCKPPVDGSAARDAQPQAEGANTSNAANSSALHKTDDEVAFEIERLRPTPPRKLPPPQGALPLSEEFEIWIDPKEQMVIVGGQISLRQGMLEMFACTRGTKEHESIVSVNTRAFLVHAALLQLGAEQGRPAQFVPEFKPASGAEIEVFVQWQDEDGNEETVRAQDLIRDIRTEKAMAYPFVFAGSLFWKDPEDGKEYYMAEGGEFICVSNFGTSMLDIPVESSRSNDVLAFVTYTERIPPLGTPVHLILKPKLKDDGKEATKQ